MNRRDAPVDKDTPVRIDVELYNLVKEIVKKDRIRYCGGVKQFVNETIRDKLIELGVLDNGDDPAKPTTAKPLIAPEAEVEG
jgi:hypothetical protein